MSPTTGELYGGSDHGPAGTGVPGPMGRVLNKAAQPTIPTIRYQTASQMAEQLENVADGPLDDPTPGGRRSPPHGPAVCCAGGSMPTLAAIALAVAASSLGWRAYRAYEKGRDRGIAALVAAVAWTATRWPRRIDYTPTTPTTRRSGRIAWP
ncbi:MAG: hypothetical protein U0800_22770 [Isosphaeraceae bacterium]